jgi:hypothetical protein
VPDARRRRGGRRDLHRRGPEVRRAHPVAHQCSVDAGRGLRDLGRRRRVPPVAAVARRQPVPRGTRIARCAHRRSRRIRQDRVADRARQHAPGARADRPRANPRRLRRDGTAARNVAGIPARDAAWSPGDLAGRSGPRARADRRARDRAYPAGRSAPPGTGPDARVVHRGRSRRAAAIGHDPVQNRDRAPPPPGAHAGSAGAPFVPLPIAAPARCRTSAPIPGRRVRTAGRA